MLVYITGVAGAGKSTICAELIKRGYEAYEAEERRREMYSWYEKKTGKQLDWPDVKGTIVRSK